MQHIHKMMKLFWITLLFGEYLCHPRHGNKVQYDDMEMTEKYEEKYLMQYIDHFNYLGQAGKNGEFKQRYLVTEKYWDKKGPILLYTGNEGSIVAFWVNTGFMFELAKKLNALVVFGEHRYYGKSLPYGKDSFSKTNIGFLSIEQALADFAVLIKYIHKKYDAPNHPVFAFGGSYGGLLSGYMRYKYPHLISGAVASSAPFFTVAGYRPRWEFFHDVTETFRKADGTCPTSIQTAFQELINLFSNGKAGLKKIQELFNLCPSEMSKPLLENNVLAWARNAFTMLAMMDYPYPAKFMADLPGHPVNVACTYMTKGSKIAGLSNITNLLYGANVTCHDTFKEYVACADPTGCGTGPAAPPWDYQACTEMILPGGSNNKTDMFPVLPFTFDMRRHYCQGAWGLGNSRKTWLGLNYFASLDDVKKASRIIFPNGDLDPWRSGGVLEDLSPSLIAIKVEGGAHHLDLRASNPADPQSVIDARVNITNTIMQWMQKDHDDHAK